MSHATIWISYDLGIRGDYEGLYAWLDGQDAKECGDSLAVLVFRFEKTPQHKSLPDALKAELKKSLKIDKATRIYVVYRDEASNKNKGKFIFGGRRAPTWTGYAQADSTLADEEV